jgi:hypothetical protein
VYLIGVFPCSEICRNILSNPNEKSYQEKGKVEWQRSANFAYVKVDFCFPKIDKDCQNEEDSKIVHKMMREEVEVNQNAQQNAPKVMRIVCELEFKYFPRLTDVASDRCIHKTAVEGDSGDFEHTVLRVTP